MPHQARQYQCIEVLESRIAPASVTFTFTDQDGDSVKVTSSKGTMFQLASALTLSAGSTGNPTVIDLTAKIGNTSIFAGADISVVATAAGGGDGLVKVVQINAAGVDLGKVTIGGELDSINAGDANSATPAIKSITVEQWGNGDAFDSVVVGAITTLTVNGDFNGAYLKVRGSDSEDPLPSKHLTDISGKIGTLFIGGSILGTARENGGHIFTTGDITKVTVAGSIVGFRNAVPPTTAPTDQDFNARIFSRGTIGSIIIGTDAVAGNLEGGDGASSGQIVGVDGIGSLTVKGSVKGGLGQESGSIGSVSPIGKVAITGSLLGGAGDRSGTILGFTTINSVTIGGNIEGGDGINSGAIGAGSEFSTIPGLVKIGTVVVTGDIIGGDGPSSGQIVSQGTITSVTVHNLIGGSQFETGAIGSLKGLGTILVTGDIVAGTGTRSGFITTQDESIDGGEGADPADANAPIGKVTVLGSINGADEDVENTAGYRAGGILASGNLGPVSVGGNVIGGSGFQTGRIASSHAVTSVTIGGILQGGQGTESGTVSAETTLGPVSIGNPDEGTAPRISGIKGGGILGGGGTLSGAVFARTLTKIDVFGDVRGDTGRESGVIETFGSGTAGKMGPVFVRGSVIGGSGSGATTSGSIVSNGGAIASVTIGDEIFSSSLIGGDAEGSGSIISRLTLGPVKIAGSIEGGDGANSGEVISVADITSVTVGNEVRGGDGGFSGYIHSGGNLGPVSIGANRGEVGSGSLIGGATDHSGAIIAGGKLAKIDIFGGLLGGDGSFSGRVESIGDMGAVFIAKSLIGSFGSTSATDSAQIVSGGKIASVVIGDPTDSDTESGSLTGGIALRSGQISSASDLGPVKIKTNLTGGTGDESGKIRSGGKIASLNVGSATVGGSIIGGSGNYDTTIENVNSQLGQVVARGTIGAVTVFGNVQGNTSDSEGGAYSAQIRGHSIASVTIHGNLRGGFGDHSGGFYATSGNIGPVVIDGFLEGGGGGQSGFISAEGDLPSVKISSSFFSGSGSGSAYVAAGRTLGSFFADFVSSGGSGAARPRISAGKMITSVSIGGSISDTDILAGYNTSGFEFNPDAQIGTVTIGTVPGEGSGYMQSTNIVAGLSAGGDGIFGNSNDHVILGTDNPAIFSKIASVIVKGSISNTSDPYDTYGIVAQNIVSVKIGSSTLPLTGGALNDNYNLTSPSSDTVYGEVLDFR